MNEDEIEPWNPWALAGGIVVAIALWGLGWLALGLGIGLAVEFVRSL